MRNKTVQLFLQINYQLALQAETHVTFRQHFLEQNKAKTL